jgi:RNA polymerase sigma factor (sigma-70 family)
VTTATTAALEAAETTAKTEGQLSPSAGRLGREAAGRFIAELFADHGRMVLGLCRLLLRDPVDAEDAAQQVFVSAHQALLRGSLPRDRAAWMAAIARNECRARVRARMREPLALPELPTDLPDPLASAIRAADLEAVWSALGTLPRRQRKALVLRELGGLSYHELGQALGVSHSAVESLLFRARQQVRSILAAVNAAAAPTALRDQLAQLIPGFDPGSAGVVGRAAALPVAWKLAGAAVGVGIVATGASSLHTRAPVVARAQQPRAHSVATAPTRNETRSHVGRVIAAVPSPTVAHASRHRRRREPEPIRHEGQAEAVEQGRGSGEGPGPAPTDTVQLDTSREGPGGGGQTATSTADHSGSGSSGPDGGSTSLDGGSDHSGPG